MKLCFFQGKMYTKPILKKTEKGADICLFSIGISNNYKKDNTIIVRPMTYINFVGNTTMYDILSKLELKKDILSVVSRVDIEEINEDNKVIKKYYFNAIRVFVNDKDFYSRVLGTFSDRPNSYNNIDAKYIPTDNKDDNLPF